MFQSLTFWLLFPCLFELNEANTHQPRMVFSEKDIAMRRKHLPGNHAPVQILLGEDPDTVTVVGRNNLIPLSFKNSQQAVPRKVLWQDCSNPEDLMDCNYTITVVHKMEEANRVYLCGSNSRETHCCDTDLSQQSPVCRDSDKIANIRHTGNLIIKEGESSVLVESERNSDLYVTYSGSQQNAGIHKFGSNPVGPADHNKEQHYVGLLISRRQGNSLQDKVFAFYKEKNRDTGLTSSMWIPFVTQVCMADIGGPKKHLQFSWTSQMNAKLFCGDPDKKLHFSELVHVAAVEAERWQDTRVYALFRNEWGMSAVCVYTIKDIDNIFLKSPFKGPDSQEKRSRECIRDSKGISLDVLKMIEKNSEMEEWVRPVDNSHPILINRHNYTHIYVDSSHSRRADHHPVLFLSLHNGGIHKVMQNQSETFIIAEYRPFNHSAHNLRVILNPADRKLYANSRGELVQIDVSNCAQYGNHCQECVLARDPYCSWKWPHCTPETPDTLQDMTDCPALSQVHRPGLGESGTRKVVPLRLKSKYFLQCPVSSLHAKYSWVHRGDSSPCNLKDLQCVHLIHSMSAEKEGTYECVSEEDGYKKVVAQYQLRLENRAASHSSAALVWVCLLTVLLASSK
ncbi:semaphorin-7A [Xyrichtys novacula]|uniref:Semaphorin-7A n=2 Tax=Xyrichtys novacula TaxID=13765 RepID=A0AAV1EJ52_XYRNO|nr:semaphorin-7A [Xyrichtys novacula]